MDNTRTIEKIKKLGSKKKSNKVIQFLDTNDIEVVKAAMQALSTIKDEDSVNTIAHLIDSSEPEIRIAAAGCLAEIGSEYCKTYLQHRIQCESDENVKAAISEALHCIAAN
ncbi:MAG TPA: HEAT repeat domain-containing protein [Lachnospiraceae bacterium]|nr:HEAT repeat domain-containing protein [Lachnospiraceae bacterium]